MLSLILVPAAAQVPSSSHVVLVVLENHSFETVTDSTDEVNFMPWLVSQGNRYSFAANYVTNSNGSLLDYLWLASGSCHTNPAVEDCSLPVGTHSFECTGITCASPITDDNIFRAMIAAGVSWKVYAESLPFTGYMGSKAGQYDPSHNAAKWYSDIIRSSKQQQNLVPFAPNFADDLAANRLPRHSIVIPNNLHDAHTGTPAEADSWMRIHLSPLLEQPYFQTGGDGLLIITFDNGDNDNAGRVYTAVIGPNVKPDFVSTVAYGHQNALRTILDALEIDDHPGASATADAMEDFFVIAPPNPRLSTASLQFGSQLLNVPASNTVTLSNAGSGPLAISSIATTSGSDFTETHTCGKSLDPGGSCTVTVTFIPTALGPRAGQLIFTDSAPPAQIVLLSGTGAAMDFSPPSLSFGEQIVGTSSAQTLTIKNTTNGAGTISAVSVSAGFSENNDCAILNPGASCMVNVTFAPTTAGAAIGTVTVSSGGTQATVPVNGIGTDFSIGLQSGSSFSATVTGGQTATYNLAAIGSADFTGSLSISCNGEPNALSCVSNPRTVTLSGGIPGNFSVSVPTTARGEASLSFNPRFFLPGVAVLLTVSLALVMSALVGIRRLVTLATLVLTFAFLAGCGEATSSNAGSAGGQTGTPAGTYTVVITASSGSVTRIVKLTLVVN